MRSFNLSETNIAIARIMITHIETYYSSDYVVSLYECTYLNPILNLYYS